MKTVVEIFSFELGRNRPIVTQKSDEMVPAEGSTCNVDKKAEHVFFGRKEERIPSSLGIYSWGGWWDR